MYSVSVPVAGQSPSTSRQRSHTLHFPERTLRLFGRTCAGTVHSTHYCTYRAGPTRSRSVLSLRSAQSTPVRAGLSTASTGAQAHRLNRCARVVTGASEREDNNVAAPAAPEEADGPTARRLKFTKQWELQLGRLAMFGFGASLLGELATGRGALAQVGVETGLPLWEAEPLVLLLIASQVVLPFLPASGRFVSKKDPWWREEQEAREKARRQGPLTSADFWDFVAFQIGLSKEKELFFGRLAQLGFASSLIGELLTGMGPIAQVRMEERLPMAQVEPLVGLFCMFIFLASFSPGIGEFQDD